VSHPSPNATPRLDALLSRLRQALVRQVVCHGAGTLALVTGLWLAYSYWADRLMHLPRAIRVFHGLLLVVLPGVFLLRDLLRPLRRVPDAAGLALLVGRARPDTRDVLVSALQLAPRAAGSTARELIERVVREAEQLSATVPADVLVDRRGPRRRLGLGLAAAAAASFSLLADPTLTGIFLARMLGRDVSWPQRTHLEVEIPSGGDRIRVEVLPDGEIAVLAARGTDVPVHVRARGEVPGEVTLHFEGGHETSIPATGTALFRTLLRSVQEDLAFHVTGGDDRSGASRVRIRVLLPPDVAGVAWRVRAPEYSGLGERWVHGPDVEVLAGSEVRVHVLPDPVDATGSARLFPQDQTVALEPSPFPPSEHGSAEATLRSPGDDTPGLAFDLAAEISTRIRFDLLDGRGLPNPDPGLYAMTVVEDRRPEVLLLSPARAEFDVVLGGAIPLRARVEDDFGIGSLVWDVRSETHPDEPLASAELDSRPLTESERGAQSSARDARLASTRLEVDRFGESTPLTEGQVLVLQVFAQDTRTPQGNESLSAPVRLRVVSGDEFLRRLQDGLARASDQANALYELSTRELQAARLALGASGGDGEAGAVPEDLSALVNGARRVEGDARALGRELAGWTEGLLYNRIDARASALLEALDARLSTAIDRSFHPEPWVELARRYGLGELGQADVAGTLVQVVGLALEVSEVHAREFAEAASSAHGTTDPAQARAALTRAVAAQERAQAVLDELLVRLGEWDNFQSVLTLTRDILNGQKNLNQRTRKYVEDH